MPYNPYNQALAGLGSVMEPGTTLTRRPGTALLSPEEMSQPEIPSRVPRPTPSPSPRDPSTLLQLYRGRLTGELGDRLFGAERSGDVQEAAALKGLLGATRAEMAASPLTAQARQLEDIEKARQEAQLGGFASPQEAALWQRGLEEQKIGSPFAVERERQRGALDVQREATSRALEQAQAKADLLGLMLSGRGGQPGSVSVSGLGSITTPVTPQGPLQRVSPSALAKARLEAEKPVGWFGRPRTEAIAAYKQMLQSIVSQTGADPGLQRIAMDLALDPTSQGVSIDQLVGSIDKDGQPLPPDEQRVLADMLSYILPQ